MKATIENQSNSTHNYHQFLEEIQNNFNKNIKLYGDKIFTTDVEDLFLVFLSELPKEDQQHYTCRTCNKFVNTYGGLVSITNKGKIIPLMWSDEVPDFFKASVEKIKTLVSKAKVTGVFITDKKELGVPHNDGWSHMAIKHNLISKSLINTPYQIMAEKKEDLNILINSLKEFSIEHINTAVNLLKTESLYRSEKVLGVAEWFKAIHEEWNSTKNSTAKINKLWLAVANAPVGFCHVRSSMIGTLLEDISAGYDIDTVSSKFKTKMNPLQYQRPQAEPSNGNIEQANKIISKLNASGSLNRRFARLDDLKLLWSPKDKEEKEIKNGGVFDHLKTKNKVSSSNLTPTITMTWEKFKNTVLPEAEEILCHVPNHGNFVAFLTNVDPNSTPIIQWDTEEQRNPVSWYVYHNGSYASNWNLNSGLVKVTGITTNSSEWYGDFKHQGKSINAILEGAVDKNNNSGLGLFPEILKSELHSIRSSIEAYSRSGKLEGRETASACGIRLIGEKIRVKTKLGTTDYFIDRMD